MYYNQGDYYRGDYYRGDPGLFSGIGHFVGGLARAAVHTGIGFLTGGPKGAIVGAATGLGAMTAARTHEAVLAAGGGESAYTPAMAAKHAEVVARGGSNPALMRKGVLGAGGLGGGLVATGMLPHMRRMHANRSTYITRGGGTSRWPVGLIVHPKGTEAVPSRRMNVGNPRALRRAIRRVAGFGKLVRRIKSAVGRANTAVGNVHRGRKRAFGRK